MVVGVVSMELTVCGALVRSMTLLRMSLSFSTGSAEFGVHGRYPVCLALFALYIICSIMLAQSSRFTVHE
jgi:hypothetical protein